MDADLLAAQIVEQLANLPGVAAVVIGGSRGRGSATPTSDLDLGIFYDSSQPLDILALDRLAGQLDDQHRAGLLTPVGGWGPWINGGGWLTVQGLAVDFLYRDLAKVSQVIADCRRGVISMHYQPGHPHGFASHIYMGEVATCRILYDPLGKLSELRALTDPYPPALRQAVISAYFWECDFALQTARKGAARGDVTYVAGCCFRSLRCLLQTLFALNGVYWLNEKGALELADAFPLRPPAMKILVEGAFTNLSIDQGDLKKAITEMAQLVEATRRLMDQ